MQKIFENILFGFFSFRRNSKTFLIFNLFLLLFIFDISKADTNNSTNSNNNDIEIEYLESRNELEDYIIDTGDSISLEFYPANELSGIFPVNEEGELFLPRLDETFVRGLTKSELKTFCWEGILQTPSICFTPYSSFLKAYKRCNDKKNTFFSLSQAISKNDFYEIRDKILNF